MLEALLSLTAPHHCCGCGQIGTLLCGNCKYNITSESFSLCAACGKELAGSNGICSQCKVAYQQAWCVADRRDYLEQLINHFKFSNAREAHRPLADLLHTCIPNLPGQVRIVPIPTISSHIRQRGYDHMLLVARRLGRLRRLPIDTSLRRATNSMQRGAGRRQRVKQAKTAFTCPRPLDPDVIYLLIDDVITTGATVEYATKVLRDAGAQTVWVASISRQPLGPRKTSSAEPN